MSDVAIRVEGLGKRYHLGQSRGSYSTLRDQIRDWTSLRGLRRRGPRRADRPSFWALKDVGFEVERGEVVGIIGRNGAGKSTLLKILSRITEPTEGEADIHGRVGSLLEVGTGFHPELTGRENVFLNGAILGMKRAEIARKFDEIVAFAEVERFIDTPVKHYSSGMFTRLAFAVAAHLETEILIVDEVLAVGDAEFQRKCMGKMDEASRGGRTVLFVSHNMMAMRSLCTRICLLRRGRVEYDGPVDAGLAAYAGKDRDGRTDRWTRAPGPGPLSFVAATARLVGEQPAPRLILDLHLRRSDPHPPATLALDLLDDVGTALMQALPAGALAGGEADEEVRVVLDLPPLVPGRYSIGLWVGPHNTETFDSVESAVSFEITDSPIPGRTFPHSRDHGWSVIPSRLERARP